MISAIQNNITGSKNCVHISIPTFIVCAEISLIVCTYRTKRFPVFFRMDKDRIVFRLMKIKERL